MHLAKMSFSTMYAACIAFLGIEDFIEINKRQKNTLHTHPHTQHTLFDDVMAFHF